MIYTPTESEIVKVMQQTGMDRMQAIYHLRGREYLRANAHRRTLPALQTPPQPGGR